MLIVEGADLVGKSTLCKQLRDALDARGTGHMILHLTRPPMGFDLYHGHVGKVSSDVIWDRFHMSMLAYRAHDDREAVMTPLRYELVDAAVTLVGGYTVLMHADDSIIRDRYAAKQRDEMYDLNHILNVNESYREIATAGSITVRGLTYQPRFDHVLEIGTQDGVSPGVVDSIVEEYLARQEELHAL
jgi:thymidylate kinase